MAAAAAGAAAARGCSGGHGTRCVLRRRAAARRVAGGGRSVARGPRGAPAGRAAAGGDAATGGDDVLADLLAQIIGEEEAAATAPEAAGATDEDKFTDEDDFLSDELTAEDLSEANDFDALTADLDALVGTPTPTNETKPSVSEDATRWAARAAELSALPVDKGLKPLLREYGLKLGGKKAVLVERLVEKEKELAAEQAVADAKAARVGARVEALESRARGWADRALARNRESIERGWETESYNLSMGIEPGQDAPPEQAAEDADATTGDFDAFDLSRFDMVEEDAAAAEAERERAEAEAAAAAAAAEAEAERERKANEPKYDAAKFKATGLDMAGMGIGYEMGPTDMASVDLHSGQAYAALELLQAEEDERARKGRRRPEEESLGEEMRRRLNVDVEEMLHALVLLEDSASLDAEQALQALKGALAQAHEGVSGTHYRRMLRQVGRDRRKVNAQVDIDLDGQTIQILSQRMGRRGEILEQRNDTPMALDAYRRGFLNALRAQVSRQQQRAARFLAEDLEGTVVEAEVRHVSEFTGEVELELRMSRSERSKLPGRMRTIVPRAQQVKGEHYRVGEVLSVVVQSFAEAERPRRGEDNTERYDFTSDQELNIDTETGAPLSTLRPGEGDKLVSRAAATLTCSRRAPELVRGLVERVVPEVTGEDSLLRIMGVSREPGKFTKVAIAAGTPGASSESAVRVAVGVDGINSRRLSELLGGEQVIFVEYDEDPQRYLRNAMDRYWRDDERSALSAVLVYTDDHGDGWGYVAAKPGMGAAMVGSGACNVRTASDLTGLKLSVVEEDEFEEIMKRRDEREARRMSAGWRVHSRGRFEGEAAAAGTDSASSMLEVEGVPRVDDADMYAMGKDEATVGQYDLDSLLDGFGTLNGRGRGRGAGEAASSASAQSSRPSPSDRDSSRGGAGAGSWRQTYAPPSSGFVSSGGGGENEEEDTDGGFLDGDFDLDELLGSLDGDATPATTGGGFDDEEDGVASATAGAGWAGDTGDGDEEGFDLDEVLGAAVEGVGAGASAEGGGFYQTASSGSGGWAANEDDGWADGEDDLWAEEDDAESEEAPTDASPAKDEATSDDAPQAGEDDLGVDGVSW